MKWYLRPLVGRTKGGYCTKVKRVSVNSQVRGRLLVSTENEVLTLTGGGVPLWPFLRGRFHPRYKTAYQPTHFSPYIIWGAFSLSKRENTYYWTATEPESYVQSRRLESRVVVYHGTHSWLTSLYYAWSKLEDYMKWNEILNCLVTPPRGTYTRDRPVLAATAHLAKPNAAGGATQERARPKNDYILFECDCSPFMESSFGKLDVVQSRVRWGLMDPVSGSWMCRLCGAWS